MTVILHWEQRMSWLLLGRETKFYNKVLVLASGPTCCAVQYCTLFPGHTNTPTTQSSESSRRTPESSGSSLNNRQMYILYPHTHAHTHTPAISYCTVWSIWFPLLRPESAWFEQKVPLHDPLMRRQAGGLMPGTLALYVWLLWAALHLGSLTDTQASCPWLGWSKSLSAALT